MSKRRNKVNPFCPVAGCLTKAPHLDDQVVMEQHKIFTNPIHLTGLVLGALDELIISTCKDLGAGRLFAWQSRLRAPEELYFRTVYMLFIATPDEIPHLLSNRMPNGLSAIYRKVNELILEGRGALEVQQPGLRSGTFTPMETLNQGAHAGFGAIITAIGLKKNREHLISVERYREHLSTYRRSLNHMHELFKAGRDKLTVKTALINMSRPLSYYTEQAAKQQSAPEPESI